MRIGNREYTKEEILARVGNINQIGGIRKYTLQEGYEKDCEIIEVDTGAGLKFTVSPSKGMDIVEASFCGAALNWHNVNGVVHPSYYRPEGLGWLDSYSSGLLTTCGFSNVGLPCEDEGKQYGQHGEAHNIPAREVSALSKWIDDECYVELSGVVEERKMFGHDIAMTRRISAALGVNHILVEDEIENLGAESVPLMLLYHCNFGFPLLSENTTIEIPSNCAKPREEGLEPAPLLWRDPKVGFKELVYLHSDLSTTEGFATARLFNPEFPVGEGTVGLELDMSWDTANLPELVEWYMAGRSTHSLGIEPANCGLFGRAVEREQGTVVMLEPGEIKDYTLRFALSTC